ncbi:MAG: hypothetical protein PHT07_24935 [Paludibacter sp.]|nr:hypothetical protein [Paludibacter sp.]
MIKNCKYCGNTFSITEYESKKRKGEYCSIACRNKSVKKGKGHKWKNNLCTCLECEKLFKPRDEGAKFCSSACYHKNRKKLNNIGPPKNRVNVICAFCGKEFETYPCWIRKGGGKYCSRECSDKAKAITFSGENNPLFGKVPHCKRGYRKDLNMFLRSKWEANYARLLNWGRINWSYEPKAFVLEVDGKKTTYTPDFYNEDLGVWIEVKGYMTEIAEKKIECFKTTYPNEKLILLREEYYKYMDKSYKHIIPNWE